MYTCYVQYSTPRAHRAGLSHVAPGSRDFFTLARIVSSHTSAISLGTRLQTRGGTGGIMQPDVYAHYCVVVCSAEEFSGTPSRLLSAHHHMHMFSRVCCAHRRRVEDTNRKFAFFFLSFSQHVLLGANNMPFFVSARAA